MSVLLGIFHIYVMCILNDTHTFFILMMYDIPKHLEKGKMVGNQESVWLFSVHPAAGTALVLPCPCIQGLDLEQVTELLRAVPQLPVAWQHSHVSALTAYWISCFLDQEFLVLSHEILLVSFRKKR